MAQRQAVKQATRQNQAITLKGSTAMVTEFFEYSVNRYVLAILELRGMRKRWNWWMPSSVSCSVCDEIETSKANARE